MNGSRQNPNPRGERSLDALNRTIDSLEARIEGLLKTSGREPRIDKEILDEIRQRQRMLGAAREREQRREHASAQETPHENHREAEAPRRETQPQEARPALRERREAFLEDILERREFAGSRAEASRANEPRPAAREPLREEPRRRPEPAPLRAAAPQPEYGVRDIVSALQALRQDLKRDISEGISREMDQMRAEISAIRELSLDRRLPDELREELGRLALSIDEMNQRAPAGGSTLQQELDELRHMMDGLAREDSVQRMELRWAELEDRFQELDTHGIQRELIALAYRIDGIKSELGTMGDSPALQALEDKVLILTTVIEDLIARPSVPDVVHNQFSHLDSRLDEISRAVSVQGRARDNGEEQAALRRLEDRLAHLAEKFDNLAQVQDSHRLEERLEEVVSKLGQTGHTDQAELTAYLADLSRRMDAMSGEKLDGHVLARLDELAERLEEMQYRQPSRSELPQHDGFDRLEQRLDDIARRLNDTAAAPQHDNRALMHLEAQIADLTALFRASPRDAAALPGDLDQRMASIESYMATSDEYILEAARQAAETVIQAYKPAGQPASGSTSAPQDTAQIVALAEDLRHLEQLARASDERAQTTFDSLHRTLVQIAGRLDKMEDHLSSPKVQPLPETPTVRAPMAAPVMQEPAPRILARAAEELMNDTAPAFLDEQESERALNSPDEKEKTGLLASLTQRFKANGKNEPAAKGSVARAVVEPVPSIDPSDVVASGHENDLLEPGSGKPDVRKILERVRASQAANTGGTDGSERMDYIAAARRAAKAAAQETDPLKAGAQGRGRVNAPSGKGKAQANGANLKGTLARHRRPILMAVGAILLALMTMPLVNTLTRSDKIVTPPPSIPTTSPVLQQQPSPDLPSQAPQINPAAAEQGAPQDGAMDSTQEPRGQDAPQDGEAATGEQAVQAGNAPSMPVDARPLDSPAAEGAADSAASAPASIEVPATIGPKSLAEAASRGDSQAMFEIASRFTEGRNGVTADPKEAAHWYQLAADRGFAPAQYRLGSLYEKGTGVARDMTKAIALYQSAAEAGNASAMHNLAVLQASGANGTADYKSAVSWFTKAADLGIADSQFNLAILFARGNGTAQNLEESYKWFAVAAKGGDKDAAEKRDEVGRALKPEQLARAKAAAEAWKAQPLDPKSNSTTIPDAWMGQPETSTGAIDMGKAIRNIQAILNKTGYDAGQPDGLMGKKTVTAIKAFQKSNGMKDDGAITEELVRKLLEQHQAKVGKATG
ncbi:peptidoglycan-binding protein [Rhizobium helianthi]|uniref:Peptidoglycan-binding protein n=1 Tax=Rhizobium helianthi TaxID=1132695 RepID=A0ABW4M300_9HYPH